MPKEPKVMSVVTLPIKVEKWQEDILLKRFELCRKIYNNMLHYEIKQLNKALSDPRYVEGRKIINETYKLSDEKEKKARKKSEEYKAAVNATNDVLKEYGFTEFSFASTVLAFREPYSLNISSSISDLSIAKPMWAAMQKRIFGSGNRVHFKKYDSWTSMASNGKSGIRMINENGKTVLKRENNEKLRVIMSNPKGKKLIMPVLLDEKDLYKSEMLNRKIKIVRIVKECCGTKNQFYVQLTVEGAPAIRKDSEGNDLHPVGKGKVGMYIDTTSITLAYEDGSFESISLRRNNRTAEKIADLQIYMDNSRRAMNPDNYNKDGTIKKGIMEDGKREKLHWNESNSYKKAKAQLKNLYRIEAKNRMLERQILSNTLLSKGEQFVVNDYSFSAAAMRKKVEKEDGEIEKHKKAGKDVGENAPAMLLALFDRKLQTRTGNALKKVKLSDVDFHTEGYRKYYAKELLKEIQKDS